MDSILVGDTATITEEKAGFVCVTFAPAAAADDGDDVVAGLRGTPRTLPPRYFYDDHGSGLFEQICLQPEYYPTRTERAILAERAAEICALTGPCELVELGSGNAAKARLLLDAYEEAGNDLHYAPIDVSGALLKDSAHTLIDRYSGLRVTGLIGTYEQALANLPPALAAARMIFFLGSTIGNLDSGETATFLTQVRAALASGEYFLIGLDLRKDPAIIEAAYNDDAGVTAAFNLNILRHINRRFDGDFDLGGFAHRAFYNRHAHRIEMHLECREPQAVRLDALDLDLEFTAGDSIRTEISRKFDADDFAATCAEHGFVEIRRWSDSRDWFGLMLLRAR